MTGLKTLAAAVLLSAISATSALAQNESNFRALYPNRDALNGGELTPAGRMGLQLPGGAVGNPAVNNAYGMGDAGPRVRTQRPRSPRR
jgi:hypothetical protein